MTPTELTPTAIALVRASHLSDHDAMRALIPDTYEGALRLLGEMSGLAAHGLDLDAQEHDMTLPDYLEAVLHELARKPPTEPDATDNDEH